MDYFVLACEIIFCVFILYYSIEETLEVNLTISILFLASETLTKCFFPLNSQDQNPQTVLLQRGVERARRSNSAHLLPLRSIQHLPSRHGQQHVGLTPAKLEPVHGVRHARHRPSNVQ
jgi:hypothetical protein